MKFGFKLLVIVFILISCQSENKTHVSKKEIHEMSKEFEATIKGIRTSDIYEDSNNWEKRGLNQSDKSIVSILRKSTDEFLIKLSGINSSNLSDKRKLKEINKIVDELPWGSLDTEEKEFLADVLAPAIEATGFNPWTIF